MTTSSRQPSRTAATPLALLFAISLAGMVGLAAGCADDVAGTCDSDSDCSTDLCYTQSDPGYCTSECEDEGSRNQCPDDTVCKRVEGGDPLCILICDSDDDCPDNSDCNQVSDADVKACEPVH